MDCSTLGFPVLHYLPEFAQTQVHWVGDAIQPSQPLSPSSPPALDLSQPSGFSNVSALCIRWPNYWNFSFSISPSKEYSGLISFRIDWLDLHAVQGTVKNLLQHHDLKASILRHLVSLRYKFHISTLVMEKTQQWLYWLLLAKWCLCFWIWCLGLS